MTERKQTEMDLHADANLREWGDGSQANIRALPRRHRRPNRGRRSSAALQQRFG